MRISFMGTERQSPLATLWLLSISLFTYAAIPASAEQPLVSQITSSDLAGSTSDLAWVELTQLVQHPPMRIWEVGQAEDMTYIITHGMGGTSTGDRFHKLAATIHLKHPRARVLRIDWSEQASAKIGGLPNPWKVASSIDETADHSARILEKSIDPKRTTFIGESFGNWVNARIARRLGGVYGLLAVNPANEAAGYTPPDLRKHAQRSLSFHTYSAFDTTLEIAGADVWLDTPVGATHGEQHVAGIPWLSARLEADDTAWLKMDKPLPQRRAGFFQASVTTDGTILEAQLPRERPRLTSAPGSPAPLPAADIAMTAP